MLVSNCASYRYSIGVCQRIIICLPLYIFCRRVICDESCWRCNCHTIFYVLSCALNWVLYSVVADWCLVLACSNIVCYSVRWGTAKCDSSFSWDIAWTFKNNIKSALFYPGFQFIFDLSIDRNGVCAYSIISICLPFHNSWHFIWIILWALLNKNIRCWRNKCNELNIVIGASINSKHAKIKGRRSSRATYVISLLWDRCTSIE